MRNQGLIYPEALPVLMDSTWEITRNKYSCNEVKARNKSRNYESYETFSLLVIPENVL